MKKLKPSPTNSFVLFLFLALFLLAGNSQAAIIGLEDVMGDDAKIYSDNSGHYYYDFSEELFTINADTLYITFGGEKILFDNDTDAQGNTVYGAYTAKFDVDNSGNLVSDNVLDYDDFSLTGTFTYNNKTYGTGTDSVLLRGEVIKFGWDEDSYQQFDFLFLVDPNCILYNDFYSDGLGGNITNVSGAKEVETVVIDGKEKIIEVDDWTGSWGVDHKATTLANNTAPVPIPSAAFVFAVGMSGLVGVIRKKRA